MEAEFADTYSPFTFSFYVCHLTRRAMAIQSIFSLLQRAAEKFPQRGITFYSDGSSIQKTHMLYSELVQRSQVCHTDSFPSL